MSVYYKLAHRRIKLTFVCDMSIRKGNTQLIYLLRKLNK